MDKKLKQYLFDAHYSGERNILKTKNGEIAAIVPIEDLEILEELEEETEEEL